MQMQCCDTRQYNAIQGNAMHYSAVRCSRLQNNAKEGCNTEVVVGGHRRMRRYVHIMYIDIDQAERRKAGIWGKSGDDGWKLWNETWGQRGLLWLLLPREIGRPLVAGLAAGLVLWMGVVGAVPLAIEGFIWLGEIIIRERTPQTSRKREKVGFFVWFFTSSSSSSFFSRSSSVRFRSTKSSHSFLFKEFNLFCERKSIRYARSEEPFLKVLPSPLSRWLFSIYLARIYVPSSSLVSRKEKKRKGKAPFHSS